MLRCCQPASKLPLIVFFFANYCGSPWPGNPRVRNLVEVNGSIMPRAASSTLSCSGTTISSISRQGYFLSRRPPGGANQTTPDIDQPNTNHSNWFLQLFRRSKAKIHDSRLKTSRLPYGPHSPSWVPACPKQIIKLC